MGDRSELQSRVQRYDHAKILKNRKPLVRGNAIIDRRIMQERLQDQGKGTRPRQYPYRKQRTYKTLGCACKLMYIQRINIQSGKWEIEGQTVRQVLQHGFIPYSPCRRCEKRRELRRSFSRRGQYARCPDIRIPLQELFLLEFLAMYRELSGTPRQLKG